MNFKNHINDQIRMHFFNEGYICKKILYSQESYNVTVATYLTIGRWKRIKEASSKNRKWVGVITNVYLRKMLEKPKRGLRILKIRVQELFTHRKGISTPRARHKGRQPLIECAQHDFKIIYFPKSSELLLLHFFYFFRVNKGVTLAPTYPHVQWENQTYVVL